MNKDLTDLLTEFDEMGYVPTTLTAEPEKAASEWKKRLIEAIEAENAALRERLEKAVIAPCKVGDEVCRFFRATDGTIFIRSTTIKSITANKKGVRIEFTNQFYGGYVDDDFDFLTYDDLIKDKFIFVDETYYICPRAAAEKRLKVLGGEK